MRWECRHSSSEMMYLEVTPREVVCYLDHSPSRADRWSFEEILAGDHDRFVRMLFGDAVLAELKKEVSREEETRAPEEKNR